jgi:putative isomerase
MRNRRVTKSDVTMLQHHLRSKALTCLHEPDGLLPYHFVIPTYDAVAGSDDHNALPERSSVGHYLQMYDWDACLFAQAAHHIGVVGLPLSVVRNFLALQEETGFIPRTVSPGQIWDSGDICKPFLSQTLLAQMERTGWAQHAEVAALLDGLNRYLEYFQHNRRHACGLYYWRNVLESGIDNNMALLAPQEALKDENQTAVTFPDGHLLATDLNSYLCAEFRAFSRLASHCGRNDLAQRYAELATDLAAAIEDRLWDEELGMYVNLDPRTNTTVRLRCVSGLMPVLFGVASDERSRRVMHDNVLNDEHFLRPFGVASMAASEPLSNQSPRGLYGRAIVCNWNGPVWVLPNVLVVRTLLRLGMRAAAANVARRVIAVMVKSLRETGVLHENYNADTGKQLWAPNFMSWNITALELCDLVAQAQTAGTASRRAA